VNKIEWFPCFICDYEIRLLAFEVRRFDFCLAQQTRPQPAVINGFVMGTVVIGGQAGLSRA